MHKQKPLARVEDWFIMRTYRGHYFLHGIIFNHPLHPDGKEVSTSNICGYTENNIVKTCNTDYELGSESIYNIIKITDILPENFDIRNL